MSVKKDANGRRYMQVEFEVPGTPEEVWKAIATGPGISSWLVPTKIEERDGKPVAVSWNFSGMDARADITTFDAPRTFTTTAPGWQPGSPPMAHEWTIEAKNGGTCTLRIVNSLFASTDEWDEQLEGAQMGLSGFLKNLQLYLAHFRGQHSALKEFRGPANGTEAESWDALTASLGLKGMSAGQRFTSPAGVPEFSGIVEYVNENPYDALVRIDKPAPGIAAVGIAGYPGGPAMVGLNFYLYGDDADKAVARVTPVWEEWFQQTFASPAKHQ